MHELKQPLTFEELHEAIEARDLHGGIKPAAQALGWTEQKLQHRITTAREEGMCEPAPARKQPTSKETFGYRRHLFIPDTQIRPGVPLDHIDWAAQAIVDYRPDVIVVGGDWFDMESLNGHAEPGSEALEGKRFKDDIDVGNAAFARLCAPMEAIQAKRGNTWTPRKIFTEGNHENRADRVAQADPKWLGHVGSHHCNVRDFEWHPFLRVAEIDGVNYCMDPMHKALKADLTSVSLGDLAVGDQLLAFEEWPRGFRCGRRYATATVEALEMDKADLFAVELSNGQVFRVTADHLWLVRNYNTTSLRWVRTDALTTNMVSPHLFDQWSRGTDYDSGWLGGMLDGEGCLSKPNCKQGGIQVCVAQNPGQTLERLKRLLRDQNVPFNEHQATSGCHQLRILGPSHTKLGLLARTGAERLIGKFRSEMLGRVQQPDNENPVTIKRVVGDKVGEIAKIKTSTGTMIVDGHPHHNCHYFQNSHSKFPIGGSALNRLNKIGATFVQGHVQGFDYGTKVTATGKTLHGVIAGSYYLHREEYRGNQGQKHWSGLVVLNQVRGGNFDIMPLRISYLCRRYTGMQLIDYMNQHYAGQDWSHLEDPTT